MIGGSCRGRIDADVKICFGDRALLSGSDNYGAAAAVVASSRERDQFDLLREEGGKDRHAQVKAGR